MKIQNPNLRGEELDLVLDYDRALAHFFKMRGLSKDGQEAFNVVVGIYPNTLYGIKEAFGLLDQEHSMEVPRYLNEKPVSVQARVILLNIEPVPHEGNLRRAAVILRVSAVWIEIMKRLKVATVSDTFAGRLKETLGDVPMSYLADGNTCLNIIGGLLGWSKAWMAAETRRGKSHAPSSRPGKSTGMKKLYERPRAWLLKGNIVTLWRRG